MRVYGVGGRETRGRKTDAKGRRTSTTGTIMIMSIGGTRQSAYMLSVLCLL